MTTPAIIQRSELTRILWSFRREFAAVAVLSLVANVLMLSPTLYMLQVFDRVMTSHNELTLIMLSLIILVFFGVMAISEWIRTRLLVRAGVRFDEALNDRIFRAGFQAELEQSGHNSAQALSDLTTIRQFLTGTGIIAFFDAPWTPVYIAVMFMLHPILGWLSIFFVCNLVALAIYSQWQMAKPGQERAQAEVEVNQYLFSKLRNSEAVEAMGMLGDLRRRWSIRHRKLIGIQSRSHAVNQRLAAMVKFLRYTQQAFSLGAGALLAIHGEITIGSMIAANVMMSRASAPIDVIVATWSTFLSARSAFDRVKKLLDAHPDEASGQRVTPPAGHIRVEGLVATAPGREEPILKNLSADFPAGEFTAILGPSGSGKSTLARSLIGIWPHTEGRVLLDGEPLTNWDRTALGAAIGYLPQDIELFDGTIAENIARFGDVESKKVIEAARRAGLHEMILRFPKGYDTPIGDGGSVLSGGQRQRIALARALYGDPQIIVLDEPNANLDDAGEYALVRAIQDLKARGKTIFLITHRPSGLAIADRLVVLKSGAIEIDGPREKLLATPRAPAAPAPAANSGLAPQPA
jgi:ATP-binding cassette, subfamily C, bacterial exporter for protease/lipase